MTPRSRWGLVAIAALIAVALIATVSAVLTWHLRSSAGQRVRILHENPSVAGADKDAAALLQYVNDTLQFVGAQRLAEAGAQLTVLRLASVPPSLRQLVDRVGQDVQSISSGLKDVDTAIAEAQMLLQANRRAEARKVMIQARELLRRNGGFVQDNRQTLLELGDRLGVSSLPAGSPARRTFDRIQQVLGALDARNRRIADLLGRIEKGERVSFSSTITSVRWAVPEQAYPARPFVVSGIVTTAGAPADLSRELVFDLDGRILGRLLAHGRFRMALTPPADFPPGWHALTVLVEARGQYARFTEMRPLELISYPITVEIDPVHLTWFPGALTVSGRAASRFGPLAHARIEVHLGNASGAADATREGRFKVTVVPPFALGLIGSQRAQVSVFPVAPWEAPTEVETRATVVNLWNLGLASTLAPLAAVYVRARRRRMRDGQAAPAHPAAEVGDEAVFLADTLAQHAESASGLAGDGDTSPGTHVMRLYVAAVRDIEGQKRVRFWPHMTLREFQRAATPALRGGALAQMTALAELALYSSRPITEDHVEAMRRLREDLDEELRGSRA